MSTPEDTTVTYGRVDASGPSIEGDLRFRVGASNLTLSRTEAGGFHLDPPVAPPPPPPTSFWLPAPGEGWAATPSMQTDFTKLSGLPSGDWDYAGAPGGTENCEWLASQVSLVTGKGVKITTQWNGSDWITGAFGTPTQFTCPLVVRFYDLVATANILGHNKIQLVWAGEWIEADIDETQVDQVGQWGVSWARTHDDSNANQSDPMSWLTPQPLGVVTCHEARLSDNGDGTGTYAILLNGTPVSSTVIDSSMWAAMTTNEHWIGTQDELYSIGSGDKSAVDERYVLGIEVYEEAA